MVMTSAAFVGRQPVSTVEVFEIENQTDRHEYDYLCKGTTMELMRRLSWLEDVRVIPLYATRSKPPVRQPCQFSLDGVLQAHNGQIRLSVLLTDNNDHTITWSEKFDREGIADPLSLQSEIAQGTVAALRERLGNGRGALPLAARVRRLFPGLHTAVAAAPTTSNTAFDLYMRGRHLLEEASPQSSVAAIDYFKRAVQEDPGFALAHSALSDACINTMDNSLTTDPELLNTAREHAERAVSSAPDLAEAHASLAAVRQSVWDWSGSERSYKEALRLKPTFARAHLWYAGLIIQFGRVDEALKEAQTAIEQDPYDRATPRTYGIFLFLGRRYREAASMLETAVAGKELPLARHNLGQVYSQMASMSRGEEAAAYYRKAFAEADTVAATERRSGSDGQMRRPSISDRMFAIFYTQSGDLAKAQPYVDRVIEDMNAGRVSPVVVAWLHALRGDYNGAMDLLERAEVMHDRRLLYIKVNPYLDGLHSNPRFQGLLRRVGL
jgi:Tfp pilus assembly protein PilF/TolB-like protein